MCGKKYRYTYIQSHRYSRTVYARKNKISILKKKNRDSLPSTLSLISLYLSITINLTHRIHSHKSSEIKKKKKDRKDSRRYCPGEKGRPRRLRRALCRILLTKKEREKKRERETCDGSLGSARTSSRQKRLLVVRLGVYIYYIPRERAAYLDELYVCPRVEVNCTRQKIIG